MFKLVVDIPIDDSPIFERHVGGKLHGNQVARTDGIRTQVVYLRVEVAEVSYGEDGRLKLLFGRVGVDGVVGVLFRHRTHHTATIFVAVQSLGERVGYKHTGLFAHRKRVGIHPIVFCKRTGIGIVQINPLVIALIYLPLILEVDTRSGDAEGGKRTVANRNRLGMFDDTRGGYYIYPRGVGYTTLPWFVQLNLVAGALLGTNLNGVGSLRNGGEVRERRPCVGGQFAAARYADNGTFAGQDELVGGYFEFRFLNHINPDNVRRLGSLIHTTQRRIQIYPYAVAVFKVAQHNSTTTVNLNGVFVAIPDIGWGVALVNRGLGKANRGFFASRDGIHVGGDVGSHLHVDTLVEFHLHGNG